MSERRYDISVSALYLRIIKPDRKQKLLYRIISISAVIGLVASFDDLVEKYHAQKFTINFTCNLNSVFMFRMS